MKKLFLFITLFTFIFPLNCLSSGPICGGPIGTGGIDIGAPGTIGKFQLDHNVEILNADRTILIIDKPIQWFDANGADRNVTLCPEADSTDLVFTFYNDSDGAGEDLITRDDTPTTLITIGPGQEARVSCDGTSWKVLGNVGVKYDAIAQSTIFPQVNDAATPTMAFGDGDTGIYEYQDDVLFFVTGGVYRFGMSSTQIYYPTSAYFSIQLEETSATNPIYCANGDDDTGIGFAAADQLSLIAGASEVVRLTQNDAAADTVLINGQLKMTESSDPAALADHVFFYGKNVAGTGEAFAADAAANAAQLTPHNFSLFEPDSKEAYPWSYYAENKALGIKINVDMAGMIRAVEGLTGKTFIYTQNIAKDVDLEKVYKDKWIADYIKAGIQETELTKDQALEVVQVDADKWYEVETVDPETGKVTIIKERNKLGEEITGYEFVDEEVKPQIKIIWETEKIDKIQVKENVKFNKIDGKFYMTTKPTKAQAITVAETGFVFSPPKWLGDRLNK